MPHSGCNAFVSAITFDKFSCKSYLKDVDFVKCAKDIFLRKGESVDGLAERAVEKLGLPMFVKPTDGGSRRILMCHKSPVGTFVRLQVLPKTQSVSERQNLQGTKTFRFLSVSPYMPPKPEYKSRGAPLDNPRETLIR